MITIITGTNRENSNSKKVANTYFDILKNKGLESQVFNLEDLHSNFISEDLYGKRTNQGTEIIKKYIETVNQFIFVIPEYNGSFPGVLKLFIDGIEPAFFNNKSAILVGVSSGRAGNIVGLNHFTTVLNHVKMEVLSNKILLSQIESLLGENGFIENEISLKLINEQIDLMQKMYL